MAGQAHQLRKFDVVERIEEINPEARKWLDKIPVVQWALAHNRGESYGIMTTNLSEVFNSVLKGARSFPISVCVQLTFYPLVSIFNTKRGLANGALEKGDPRTLQVMVKIQGKLSMANTHKLTPFHERRGVFKVMTTPQVSGCNKVISSKLYTLLLY